MVRTFHKERRVGATCRNDKTSRVPLSTSLGWLVVKISALDALVFLTYCTRNLRPNEMAQRSEIVSGLDRNRSKSGPTMCTHLSWEFPTAPERQTFENLMLRRPLAIEQRALFVIDGDLAVLSHGSPSALRL